jgi:hypothetical protein
MLMGLRGKLAALPVHKVNAATPVQVVNEVSAVETLSKAALLKRQGSEIAKLKSQLEAAGCAAAASAMSAM